ncbi:MAG: type IV toxin-antitoxin system AbiEi family antitoxin [Leucobacter sp.]
MDDQLAQRFLKHFKGLGLRFLEPVDLTEIPLHGTTPLTLVHEFGRSEYRVGFTNTLTASAMNWVAPQDHGEERILLLGPRVTERSAEMLRQMEINYLDQSGNAFINFAGVHIDVRGRRAEAPYKSALPRAPRGGVNLFSTKRSQVIFSILSWPELLRQPVRTLAAWAGVSLGQAQETLELLTQYGFLDDRRQIIPNRRDRLIDQWAAAYPTGLGSDANTARFSGDWQGFDPGTSAVWVSGEAAVPELLRPETVVLYTYEFPTQLIRAHRWRRNDAEPNIFLRHRFWKPVDSHESSGINEPPWLLIYADLLAANDSRQREAAEQLRSQQH